MKTIFEKDMVDIPQSKYERLVENETRYIQLFELVLKGGNDEILKIIDKELYEKLTKNYKENEESEGK